MPIGCRCLSLVLQDLHLERMFREHCKKLPMRVTTQPTALHAWASNGGQPEVEIRPGATDLPAAVTVGSS